MNGMMLQVLGVVVGVLLVGACGVGGSGGEFGGKPAVRSGYAPVNGLRIYYEVHGSRVSGQVPVVLMHGGGSTIETSFAKLIPQLARSREVIAFEQQGHGHTADVEGRAFSFEQSADDAAGLLEYLKVERADFVGYSNGGTIALAVGVRHPEKVRKLVIVSGMFKRDGMAEGFWEGMGHATLETMPGELKAAYVKVAPHPEQLPVFFEKSVKRMMEFQDWPVERLKGIEVPTLVMVGDKDVVRVEHGVEMARAMPRGELAVLPGTDHMQVVEWKGWEVGMVEGFLGE